MFQSPSVQIRLDGTFPTVLGTEALLTQCISNLLSNAVKFVQPGTAPLVRVWSETAEGTKVRLCVQDNGVGIERGSHAAIFGIFQRLSNRYEGQESDCRSLRSRSSGWGAGLGCSPRLDWAAHSGLN